MKKINVETNYYEGGICVDTNTREVTKCLGEKMM